MCWLIQGKRTYTAVLDYTQAYPSVQNIKPEPGLQQTAAQQVKLEPSAEYTGGYYAGDEDNYDMFYDEAGAMYTDPGGSFAHTGHYDDDATQLPVMEYSKPRAHKVLLVEFFGSFLFGRISDIRLWHGGTVIKGSYSWPLWHCKFNQGHH